MKIKMIKICFALMIFLFLFLFFNNSLYSAQEPFEAQDLLNSASRAQTIEDLSYIKGKPAQYLYLDSGAVAKFYLGAKYINGFPIITEYGVIKGNLFRVFSSAVIDNMLMTEFDNTKWMFGLGVFGMRYGLKTKINLENPSDDYAGSSFDVSDYISDQFFDDMIIWYNKIGKSLYIDFGLIHNAVYMSDTDGTLKLDQEHKKYAKLKFFINARFTMLAELKYRWDTDSSKFDFASLSSKGLTFLLLLLCTDYYATDTYLTLEENSDNSKKYLPTIELKINYYNFFKDLTEETVRGYRNQSNITYGLDIYYKYHPIQIHNGIELFSKSYSKKQEDNILRKFEADMYYIIQSREGEWFLAPFIGCSYFVDSGFKIMDNTLDKIAFWGYRAGIELGYENKKSFGFSCDLSVSYNYSKELELLLQCWRKPVYELGINCTF